MNFKALTPMDLHCQKPYNLTANVIAIWVTYKSEEFPVAIGYITTGKKYGEISTMYTNQGFKNTVLCVLSRKYKKINWFLYDDKIRWRKNKKKKVKRKKKRS